MSWLQIVAPLIAVILAYWGGYIAGKKSAELKQIKKEQGESTDADEIIDNNYNMSADDIDNWLRARSKK